MIASYMGWINFFQKSKFRRGTEDLIPAEKLNDLIVSTSADAAYHSVFDMESDSLMLEEDTGQKTSNGKRICTYHVQSPELLKKFPRTVTNYSGPTRPAFGYAWFDFDSDDPLTALQNARAFASQFDLPGTLFYFSGSKGFHVAIPFGYFGIDSKTPHKNLHAIAAKLKETYPTLDTSVYNPQRKFRVPGTAHEKTGLFKTQLPKATFVAASVQEIIELSRKRVISPVPQPPQASPFAPLEMLNTAQAVAATDSISLDEWRKYRQPEGAEAMAQCLFLQHCKNNPAQVNEPQWYAMASIVGRFKDGRAKFHQLSKGHPGYQSEDADDKLTQAIQSAGPRTCAGINSIWGGCKDCPLFDKIKSPVVIQNKEVIASEATGFYLLEIGNNGQIKRIPMYSDLLRALNRDTPFVVISEMKAPFLFEKTQYVASNPIEIKHFAETKFDPPPQERMRSEFYAKVMANNVKRKNFFVDTTRGKINFKNGVLELKDMTMGPHSPEYGFRWTLPYDYDPNAKCPVFDAWILDVMCGDASLVALLQEFMGYVVRGDEYTYHKALWLSGGGRNGKSTFIKVLKNLIGHANYSTVSIKAIVGDRFAAAELDGKIANFSEETSPEELSDSGPFKNLTGDGEMTAQRKYGDPYTFANRAKLIMSYNQIPHLKDLSTGMLSRPIVIPWNKDLSDEASQDKSLPGKLDAELSGIFNFAFEGWKRLDAQKRFSEATASKIEMEDVRLASDTALQWFLSYIKVTGNPEDKILPREAYAHYRAKQLDFPLSEQKFYKRLVALKKFECKRTQSGMLYTGIKLVQHSLSSHEEY